MGNDTRLLAELAHNPFVQCILYIFSAALATLIGVLCAAALQAWYVGVLRRSCRLREPDLGRRLPRWSWARQRLARVVAARGAGAELDLAEVSSDTASRAHLWLSFARHASSVLVLLGLCGAVYGLSSVITRLADPLDHIREAMTSTMPDKKYEPANDPALKAFQLLAETLKISLKDSQGAFAASISGILATIVLVLIGWLVSFVLDSVLLWLDRVTQHDLLPLYPPPSPTAGLTEAVSKFEQGTQFLSTLGDSLTGQSSRLTDYMAGMYALVERFQEGASGIASGNERLQASQDKMHGLVERFVDLSSGIRDAQTQSSAGIDALGRRMDETLQRLEAQGRTQGDLREQMEEGLQKNINLVRDLFETKLARIATSSAEAVERKLDEHGTRLAEMSDRHAEFLEGLTNAFTRAKGHKQLVDGLKSLLEEERQTFSQHLRQTREGLQNALAADRTQLVKELSSSMAAVVQELKAQQRPEVRESPPPAARPARDPALARLVGLSALAVPTLTVACLVYLGQTVAPQSWTLLGGGLATATCGLAAITVRWLR